MENRTSIKITREDDAELVKLVIAPGDDDKFNELIYNTKEPFTLVSEPNTNFTDILLANLNYHWEKVQDTVKEFVDGENGKGPGSIWRLKFNMVTVGHQVVSWWTVYAEYEDGDHGQVDVGLMLYEQMVEEYCGAWGSRGYGEHVNRVKIKFKLGDIKRSFIIHPDYETFAT